MTLEEEKILQEHHRDVLPGKEYEKYFPKANGTNGIVNRNGDVKDTVKLMADVVKSTLNDTKKIVKILEGDNIFDSCSNIWNFHHTYYQYKLDEPGREQVRRPARSFRDRNEELIAIVSLSALEACSKI